MSGELKGTPESETPMESRFSSHIYIWQQPDTRVRYGIHIPSIDAQLNTATLRNLTVMVVQSLTSTEDALVLLHYQPRTQQIELSIPDLGNEDVVRDLARTAERGPQPLLLTLRAFYEQSADTIDVEHVEIRYNDASDLTDSSKFAILHAARATLPHGDTPGLVDFFRMLNQALPRQ